MHWILLCSECFKPNFRLLKIEKVISTEEPPFLGTFHILDIEEKFPSKADLQQVDDPKFGESRT